MCRALAVIAVLAAACSDSSENGPFDELPLAARFEVGMLAPTHVARDRYGVAHIHASTLEDAAFAQGYVMAHDRLPQMDILRRFGAGTLSELFGELDPDVIDTDLEMRMHRMRPLAEQTWQQLKASPDQDAAEIVVLLTRFADGVNAYADEMRSEANADGLWSLDPTVLVSFDPDRFVAWDPVDSLVLGRFQAFALSWTTPTELDLTETEQFLRDRFPATGVPEQDARSEHHRELLRFAPIGRISTIDGFPNVDEDRGTRSDGSGARRAPGAAGGAPPVRPRVPPALFDRARTFFARGRHTGPFGAFGPHAFMAPYAGSNNWAVGRTRSATGHVMLAGDQHLQLPNPSIFYPTHVIIEPPTDATIEGAITLSGRTDTLGITFPGIPGVVLGSNGHLAWAATVSYHDVNDVYLETIVPCSLSATGECVMFQGQPRAIETFTEDIRIGELGTITETRQVTYEYVPHHGPIIPAIDKINHVLTPRSAASALSVRYTGHQPTSELRAIHALSKATSVDDGFRALAFVGYGSQNWTMIDTADDIGWTTHAVVPTREPGATTWSPTNTTGVAPFFVLPGGGGAEWGDPLLSRYIPHAKNPQRGGREDFIVTANADPVGATFDGDPLDQGELYVGASYATGLRHERIATMLEVAAGTDGVTLDEMAAIQHDTRSGMGAKLAPALGAILALLDAGATGRPPGFDAYVGALSEPDLGHLTTARTLVASWQFETPTGFDGTETLADSAATAVFNTWMHFFILRALGDELDDGLVEAEADVWKLGDPLLARIVHALLTSPLEFRASPTTGQPALCDDLATTGSVESCAQIVVEATLAAMAHLRSEQGFGTDDVTKWQWGALHRQRIEPLFPNAALDLVGADGLGFPRPGDNFAVNRADHGWQDLDLSQSADGPAQRFLAYNDGGALKVRWALPGGAVFDSRSPHYRDLLDAYYLTHTHFDAPYTVREIVDAGEHRWLFR